jgi:hypothetical protein
LPFVPLQEYTEDQISLIINDGANLQWQYSLVNVKGRGLVLAKFRRDQNPNMPYELLIEAGSHRDARVRQWIDEELIVPVFENMGRGMWKFWGNFGIESFDNSPSSLQDHFQNLNATGVDVKPLSFALYLYETNNSNEDAPDAVKQNVDQKAKATDTLAPISATLPTQLDVNSMPASGAVEFDGTLYEYLSSISKKQISPGKMIQGQWLVNNYLANGCRIHFLRYGAFGTEFCGDVCTFEGLQNIRAVTTDNEMTVSFYEMFRHNDVVEHLDESLILKCMNRPRQKLHTGTIKPMGLTKREKDQIRDRRTVMGISRNGGGYPSILKPYREMKYSHLFDAKPSFTRYLQDLNMANLVALTARTISPLNIFLTHTAKGNVLQKHNHFIDGNYRADIGEDKEVRKYLLAGSIKRLLDIKGSIDVIMKFFDLAETNHDLPLGMERQHAHADRIEAWACETLEQSKNIKIRILSV